jgi:hypothetical protein
MVAARKTKKVASKRGRQVKVFLSKSGSKAGKLIVVSSSDRSSLSSSKEKFGKAVGSARIHQGVIHLGGMRANRCLGGD